MATLTYKQTFNNAIKGVEDDFVKFYNKGNNFVVVDNNRLFEITIEEIDDKQSIFLKAISYGEGFYEYTSDRISIYEKIHRDGLFDLVSFGDMYYCFNYVLDNIKQDIRQEIGDIKHEISQDKTIRMKSWVKLDTIQDVYITLFLEDEWLLRHLRASDDEDEVNVSDSEKTRLDEIRSLLFDMYDLKFKLLRLDNEFCQELRRSKARKEVR